MNQFKGENEQPFNLGWLDSSYFETLFPSTPWQNVNYYIIIRFNFKSCVKMKIYHK